eukprot:jgi/Mesen1/9877/ME000070S09168
MALVVRSQARVAKCEEKLGDAAFVEHASVDTLAQIRTRAERTRTELAQVQERLAFLVAMEEDSSQL